MHWRYARARTDAVPWLLRVSRASLTLPVLHALSACQDYVSLYMGAAVQSIFPPEGVSQPVQQSMFQRSMDVAQYVNPHSAPINFVMLDMGMLFPLAYQMHKVCRPLEKSPHARWRSHPCDRACDRVWPASSS